MFKVNGSDIYISRGEDASLLVSAVGGDGAEYVPAAGDSFVFTVREPLSGESVLGLRSDDGAFALTAADTAELGGRYDYEAALEYADGHRVVIIGRTPNRMPHFYVMEG